MTAALQLDLFASDTETRRLVDALTALRDVVPSAMEVVIHLTDWRSSEDRSVGRSGAWWYAIRRDGFHYAAHDELPAQPGWPTRLARRATWAELAELLADDPRREQLIAWARALPEPAWQELTRPKELWSRPEMWHPGYIASDHERPGWPQRIAAWHTLQQLLTDAITRLDPEAAR